MYYICNLNNKKTMKYFVSYTLDLIDGISTESKSYSKIIDLDNISEEEIWNKLNIEDNYKEKRLNSITKL